MSDSENSAKEGNTNMNSRVGRQLNPKAQGVTEKAGLWDKVGEYQYSNPTHPSKIVSSSMFDQVRKPLVPLQPVQAGCSSINGSQSQLLNNSAFVRNGFRSVLSSQPGTLEDRDTHNDQFANGRNVYPSSLVNISNTQTALKVGAEKAHFPEFYPNSKTFGSRTQAGVTQEIFTEQYHTNQYSNNRIQPGTTTPTDPARLRNRTSLNTFPKPSSTTTTTISSSPGTNTYTPLGAAGPVHNGRRVGPNNFNRGQVQPNQVWGDGVANQGRVVASNQTYTMSPPRTSAPTNVTTSITNARTNGTSQVYQNPIITTTTTVMSSRRRAPANFTASPASMSRPVSSMNVYQTPASNSVTPTPTNNTSARPSPITSPDGSRLTQTTSNVSNASYASKNNNISRIDSDRSRKRMSLTDVSGIRRVFLRKKSDKS